MERLALRRRSPIPYLHKLCNVCKGNISPNEWSKKTLTRRSCAKSLETQAIDQHHGGTLGSRQLHVLLSILQRAAIEQTYFATSLMPYHCKGGYVYYACIISTKFNRWHLHCVLIVGICKLFSVPVVSLSISSWTTRLQWLV